MKKQTIKDLINIANELDQLGFYKEADMVDEIMNADRQQSVPQKVEFVDTSGGGGDLVSAPEITQREKALEKVRSTPTDAQTRHNEQINKIRQEVGLGAGTFDKTLAAQLSKVVPETWAHIKQNPNERASVILSKIQDEKRQKQTPQQRIGPAAKMFEGGVSELAGSGLKGKV